MSRVKPQGRVPMAHRDALRRHLEGFACIDAVSDELREVIEREFPELLGKMPPKMPPAPSTPRRRRTRTGSAG